MCGVGQPADLLAHRARSAAFVYLISESHPPVGQVYLHVSSIDRSMRLKLMTSRENANDTNQVVIVDLSDANNVIRRPSEYPLCLRVIRTGKLADGQSRPIRQSCTLKRRS